MLGNHKHKSFIFTSLLEKEPISGIKDKMANVEVFLIYAEGHWQAYRSHSIVGLNFFLGLFLDPFLFYSRVCL